LSSIQGFSDKAIYNRKGYTQWETKAARRIKARVRNKRKANRISRQKRSSINNPKGSSN